MSKHSELEDYLEEAKSKHSAIEDRIGRLDTEIVRSISNYLGNVSAVDEHVPTKNGDSWKGGFMLTIGQDVFLFELTYTPYDDGINAAIAGSGFTAHNAFIESNHYESDLGVVIQPFGKYVDDVVKQVIDMKYLTQLKSKMK